MLQILRVENFPRFLPSDYNVYRNVPPCCPAVGTLKFPKKIVCQSIRVIFFMLQLLYELSEFSQNRPSIQSTLFVRSTQSCSCQSDNENFEKLYCLRLLGVIEFVYNPFESIVYMLCIEFRRVTNVTLAPLLFFSCCLLCKSIERTNI